MSSYERYHSEAPKLRAAILVIRESLGQHANGDNDANNDKARVCFKVTEMGHGYYGSSSYYTSDNSVAKGAIEDACYAMRKQIGGAAIAKLEADIAQLKRAATQEAKFIVDELAPAS